MSHVGKYIITSLLRGWNHVFCQMETHSPFPRELPYSTGLPIFHEKTKQERFKDEKNNYLRNKT